MNSLCVFTTGTDLTLLRQSCDLVGVPLQTYDVPWSGYVSVKIKAARDFLSTRDEPYSMWVDGNDSLILKPITRILDQYTWSVSSAKILIAAEANCWPDSSLMDQYPFGAEPRFINSGGWIGPTSLLVAILCRLSTLATTEDDQLEWTKLFLSGVKGIAIDHGRRVFASISDGQAALDCDSCVKHWNGRVPGREEYYERFAAQHR